MASPTAIKALTSQLARQLDELNITFDPLVDSFRINPPHSMQERHRSGGAYPSVLMLRVWLKELEQFGDGGIDDQGLTHLLVGHPCCSPDC